MPVGLALGLVSPLGKLNNATYMNAVRRILEHSGVEFLGMPNWISSKAYFDVGWPGAIQLGSRTVVSHFARLLTHDYSLSTYGRRSGDLEPGEQLLLRGRVILQEDSFVGMGATILPGVTVGRGSVVGAGSVVTSDVPDDTVVGGSPARPLVSTGDRYARMREQALLLGRRS